MKYFWFYAIGSIVIMIVCSYIVTIRETFETNLKYENVISNLDIEYHKSEDQIREDNKHKMNVLYVKGDNGKPIGINMESTQTFPTYNPPGHFRCRPSCPRCTCQHDRRHNPSSRWLVYTFREDMARRTRGHEPKPLNSPMRPQNSTPLQGMPCYC